MWNRADLKSAAKVTFKANYWGSVIAGVLAMLFLSPSASSYSQTKDSVDFESALDGLSSEEIAAILAVLLGVVAIIGIVACVLNIFVFNPLRVGVYRYFLQCKGDEKHKLGDVGFGFTNSYGNVVKTMFLKDLFIALWSLLFIIPGIYKYYQWYLVPYILADNPGIDANEARELSKQMMDGNKWKTFVLALSFIGWVILGVVTLGIVYIFWTEPYYEHTFAELYHTLKAEHEQSLPRHAAA